MREISDYIRDLYKDGAEISDLVGILQELLFRVERLELALEALKSKETT